MLAMGSNSRRRLLQSSVAWATLGLLAGCGSRLSWDLHGPRLGRIGYLSTYSTNDPYLEVLRQALHGLGWIEGQNLTVERRYAAGNNDQLPALAMELVGLQVELIHVSATPAALAARAVSTTLPIVIATAGDPVAQGLAESLPHPGGNVTGLTSIAPAVTAKRIEFLKATVPQATRLGVVRNPTYAGSPTYEGFLRAVEMAAATTGLALHWMEITSPDRTALASSFARLMQARPELLLILPEPVSNNLRVPIAELALHYRLPTIGDSRDAAQAGQLIGYGPSYEDQYRRSAEYVDKILKGANPAELPIERPSKFDLVINLKTAQALDLTIPSSVLQQATETLQ
jgi:ABC-type uncharacterized transport system substrate-binding protein